jgi:hypothetical protein
MVLATLSSVLINVLGLFLTESWITFRSLISEIDKISDMGGGPHVSQAFLVLFAQGSTVNLNLLPCPMFVHRHNHRFAGPTH